MIHRISRLIVLLLLSGAAAGSAQAQLPATPEARLREVEHGLQRAVQVAGRPVESRTISARMADFGVPAVSVAVIHDGRIDWARAWGVADVAANRAATPATLFQAASMSKPLAALAALVMVDAGELSLDADVNTALRSWQLPPNALTTTQPVTLRQLLSHTAGTTVHGFPGYAAGAPLPSIPQILDGVAPANTPAVRVDSLPGSSWRYSGGGFTIVQLLLTDVSGRSYPELLRSRVLAPLGMHASTAEQPLPDSLGEHAATGYRADLSPIAGRYHTYPEMAAAGLWTTPSDYARYVLGVQGALRGAPGAILSRERTESMLGHVMGGYGLGVGVAGEGDSLRFSHGGANEGFRSTFVGFAARGEGIVVMTNSDNGAPLAWEIVLAAARVYGWPGLAPQTVTPIAIAPAALAAYTGVYDVPGARLVVSRDGDRLLLSEDGAEPLELVPTGPDLFMYLGRGITLHFERDAAGRVTGIRAGRMLATRAER